MPALESSDLFARQLAQFLTRLSTQVDKAEPASLRELQRLVIFVIEQLQQGIVAAPLSALAPPLQREQLMHLTVVGREGEQKPLILSHDYVWLHRYYQYETRLAQALCTLIQAPAPHQSTNQLRAALQAYFPANKNNTVCDWQQVAAVLALQQAFLIISGGPGTGKTTTITRILALLIEQAGISPKRIQLAAPTGKAAMRMQESIQQARRSLALNPALQAKIPDAGVTLHRLLGYRPGRVDFRFNAHHPLPLDVLIIDEASMIDIALFAQVLEALPPHARLILLGDKDQLAAVETGSVFRDICANASNDFTPKTAQTLSSILGCTIPEKAGASRLQDHIVILEHSYRFAADSGIGELARAIRMGDSHTLLSILERIEHGDYADLQWLQQENSLGNDYFVQAWQDYWRLLTTESGKLAEHEYIAACFQAFNQFRILAPMRKGMRGTEALNDYLEQFASRRVAIASVGNRGIMGAWYLGRPIMVTQNDYRQRLFNGDIGLTLPDSTGQLRVWFPTAEGRFRHIAPVRLPIHESAWAMTIHKSQGSEFERVLLIMPEHSEVSVLGRELLYTGVTRAKQHLQLLATIPVLEAALTTTMPPSSCMEKKIANGMEK